MIPVCVKVACFSEELFKNGINEDLLKDIITSSNTVWENNMLIIEEAQKHMFFSDEIKKTSYQALEADKTEKENIDSKEEE